jgi:4-diphosphocytidyl-2-C-methyl-D-erythritol kinase
MSALGSKLTRWKAPAKLNLFLHVVGRRADGYHLLQTVFQFLDYADELIFRRREDGRLRRRGTLPGVDEDGDLVVCAARLLQRESGARMGVDIVIRKRLPVGGGLGGGSSDAATTLVALNQLWGTRLSQDELLKLGLTLGADVPVFLGGHAAWAEGIGECLQPVQLAQPWYLVIDAGVRVSTAAVFSDPELTRNCVRITIGEFMSGQASNVCEPVVRTRYPAVGSALDWLNRYAPARLTGTGGCVFAAFQNRVEAERTLALIPAQWQGFVAKGLNESPLLRQLGVGD